MKAPPAKRAKNIQSIFKKMMTIAGKQTNPVCEIDLVTAARDVLGMTSLSRKSFTTHEMVPFHRHFYCEYGNKDSGVVDYGTATLDGLDEIGVTGVLTKIVAGKHAGQRVFSSKKASIDHMLCSIFLFHKSAHADMKRLKFFTRTFQHHLDKNGQTDTFVCVKKQHGKVGDSVLFGLFKAHECAYVVLALSGQTPKIIPLSCPPRHSLFG